MGWRGQGSSAQPPPQPLTPPVSPTSVLPLKGLCQGQGFSNHLEELHSAGAGGQDMVGAPQHSPDSGVPSPHWDLTCCGSHSQKQKVTAAYVPGFSSML